MLRSICVFCGSSAGTRPAYRRAADAVGRLIGRSRVELVYGGGRVGLMGVVADAALAEGGRVVGVIPQALADKEVAHAGLSKLHIVGSMHERKFLMADLSDAFVALPGGFGTWEEYFEVLTWSQLGIQRKACGLLNVDGYYDSLLAMVERATSDGFIREGHRGLMMSDSDPERLIERLAGSADSGGPMAADVDAAADTAAAPPRR
jgi:uncharacterized protein (TIGR00730 family)